MAKRSGKGWLAGSIICLLLMLADIGLMIYCACAEAPFAGTYIEQNLREGAEMYIAFAVEIVAFLALGHLCLRRYKKENNPIGVVWKIYYFISFPVYYLVFGIFLLIYYVIGVLGLLGKKFMEADFSSSSGDAVTAKDEYGKEHKLSYYSQVGSTKYYKDETGNEWKTDDGKKFTSSK